MPRGSNQNSLVGLKRGWDTAILRRNPANQRNCKICGDRFNARGRMDRSCCSVLCKAITQKGKPTKVDYKKRGKMIYCENCNKERYCYPSHFYRFCSVICRDKIMKGSGSPQWQGGKTKIKELLRKSKPYRIWRNKCLKRDKYKCVNCSQRATEVDHIIPFSTQLGKLLSLKGKKINLEEALKYKPFWNVKNGRSMCHPCHQETDTYFNGAKKYKLQKTI